VHPRRRVLWPAAAPRRRGKSPRSPLAGDLRRERHMPGAVQRRQWMRPKLRESPASRQAVPKRRHLCHLPASKRKMPSKAPSAVAPFSQFSRFINATTPANSLYIFARVVVWSRALENASTAKQEIGIGRCPMLYCITLRSRTDASITGWYDGSQSRWSTDRQRQKLFHKKCDARVVCHELRKRCPRSAEVINIEAEQNDRSL